MSELSTSFMQQFIYSTSKLFADISFCSRVCSALKYQMLLQFCAQPLCKQSLKISRRPLRDLLISERELVIYHVVQLSSSIFLLVLFIRNVNSSTFLSLYKCMKFCFIFNIFVRNYIRYRFIS